MFGFGPKVPAIGVHELKKMMDERQDFVLLDVRDADEYEQSHIEGSVLIPLADLASRTAELDKARKHVVMCLSGGRSATATKLLRDKGFDAVNLSGGILAWAGQIDPGLAVD